MKAKRTILVLCIAWLIAAVMLVFAAAEKQSDSFYALLRWVCCAVFAYSASTSFQMKRLLWVCIFVVLAALFNPIFVLHLDRTQWIVADWFSIGAMVITAFVFWKFQKPHQILRPYPLFYAGIKSEEFAHETHYFLHCHQHCSALIRIRAIRNPTRVREQQE